MTLLKRMSFDLCIDEDYILEVARKSKYYYKHYTISKKNGGVRNIYHPSPVLKTFQYWLVHQILSNYPISKYAHAYQKDSSIKKNAKLHADKDYILHIDIQNFFESITKEHLRKVFVTNKEITDQLKLDESDFDLIYKLCFFKERLTIGSVSSPIISNIVMYNIDQLISEEVSPLVYTRYADDMVFSSKNFINNDYLFKLETILKDNQFFINKNKTKFMSKKHRKSVTGLIIDSGRVTIGLKNKRRIKSMVYKKLQYNIGDSNIILGHLFFLKDIEPEYFDNIIIKYAYFGNVLDLLKNNIVIKEAATTKE